MNLYCDNAATTFPKPESVYQAVSDAMRLIGVSPGRGGYRQSLEASRILLAVRESIASLFNIQDASRVILTHNATEALNLALRGILLPGDHVVTSAMEHNSLLRPLHHLREFGIDSTIVPVAASGCIDPDDIRGALTPRTRMIALSHVSNVCGVVQPVDGIAAIAREAGVLFLLDAAQSAGSIAIDVVACGIDLLAVPGHKGLYGPQGTGFLYAAPGVPLRPLLVGGTGSNATERDQPIVFPEGFEPGTRNLPGIAGLKAAVDFVVNTGVAVIGTHERQLVSQLASQLRQHPAVTLHGYDEINGRNGVLSFTINGADPSAVAFILDHRFGIAVRAGLHCAPDAHKTLGTFPAGTVRVSPGWFTTAEDIAFVADAIVQCAP